MEPIVPSSLGAPLSLADHDHPTVRINVTNLEMNELRASQSTPVDDLQHCLMLQIMHLTQHTFYFPMGEHRSQAKHLAEHGPLVRL